MVRVLNLSETLCVRPNINLEKSNKRLPYSQKKFLLIFLPYKVVLNTISSIQFSKKIFKIYL